MVLLWYYIDENLCYMPTEEFDCKQKISLHQHQNQLRVANYYPRILKELAAKLHLEIAVLASKKLGKTGKPSHNCRTTTFTLGQG